MFKVCKDCGKPISSKRGAYLCKDCAKKIKSKSAKPEHVCIDCGATFVGGVRSLRCPDCKIAKRRERDRNFKKNGAARHIGDFDLCEICGGRYVVASGLQRFCPDCSEKAVSDKIKKNAMDRYLDNRDITNLVRNERRKSQSICVICGKQYERTSRQSTCSEDCQKILKRYKQELVDYNRGKRKTPPENPQKY